ncbi:MAG TPA: M56 family metallopeptidase [Gemmatimonadaceae bacterium]|nr:M56 family metallopeptidase [Gemmatimonadaceae bacterium]
MTNIFSLILEAAVKGTFLMAAIAIFTIVFRRTSASMRHSMLSFSVVAMIALPLVIALVPPLRVLSLPRTPQVTLRAPEPVRNAPLTTDNRTAVADEVPSDIAPTIRRASSQPAERLSLIQSLAFIWLGGAVVGLITLAGGLLTLRRLSHRARPVSSEWNGIVVELKRDAHVSRDVRVLLSDLATMPATWGIVRPIIVLPVTANAWDAERKRVVLMHEMAHVSRNDCLMQIAAQALCAIYWFHPGAWLTARRLRAERELACDEAVVRAGVDKLDYATHLLTIATTFRSSASSAIIGVAMARPSQLEGRLTAILADDSARKWRPSTRTRVATISGLAVLTLPLAAMRPVTPPAVIQSSLSFSVPVAASDTFRWQGSIPSGEWIELHSINGNITAELSRSGRVEIVGFKGNDVKVAIDRSHRGIIFCAVPSSARDDTCTMDNGELKNGTTGRLDFVVKLPTGVGLAAHVGRGNVVARSVESYVWGTASEGNIDISTTDLAEASTGIGSVNASFGRRSWRQDLEFYTDVGDVIVRAPADARMMIEAETRNGFMSSDFRGNLTSFGRGKRLIAKAGVGPAGMLTLRTGRGTVALRKGGNAVAEVSSIRMLVPNVDPKPNPDTNPNPSYNPNPNENSSADNTSTDSGTEGDPTGELVPITIPPDLIARFSDASIGSYPDARAIARLRDIGLTHKKQHGSDLVRERSEWALTMVRNGELINPLKSALASNDWRVRAYAAWALGESGDPRVTEALTSALNDPHWRVRMHAASALQRFATVKQVAPLIKALSDEYWQVRIAAVDALAQLGDRRAVAPLEVVAEKDPRWIVRDQARSALERMR